MSFRLTLNEEVAAALNEQICIESSAAFLIFQWPRGPVFVD